MKLGTPENENYAAVVVKIHTLVELEGLDKLLGAPLFGYQALVNKETTKEGDMGVLFVAETQLSEQYAHENNLFRHGEFNKDKLANGYLEDNRRVRAIKFRGNASNALFMPLSSLAWTGIKVEELKEGDTFDHLNDKEICKKFVKKQKREGIKNASIVEKNPRVDKKFIPEHIDSLQYFRNKHLIKGNRHIVVTQKLHGTSVRIANTIVNRKLPMRDKVAEKLGVTVLKKEFDYVYGSRKSIKDIHNPNNNHFYSEDLWSTTGEKIKDVIPQGYVLYGEIIGYVGTSPIQKNYTYNEAVGNNSLYIYRVTTVNPQGVQVDLSWDAVQQFCRNNGLKSVPELWSGRHKNFKPEDWLDKKYEDEFTQAVPLSPESPVDEGVCIRAEGITPTILKLKSPLFFEHETKMLDEEAVDMEEEEKENQDEQL